MKKTLKFINNLTNKEVEIDYDFGYIGKDDYGYFIRVYNEDNKPNYWTTIYLKHINLEDYNILHLLG